MGEDLVICKKELKVFEAERDLFLAQLFELSKTVKGMEAKNAAVWQMQEEWEQKIEQIELRHEQTLENLKQRYLNHIREFKEKAAELHEELHRKNSALRAASHWIPAQKAAKKRKRKGNKRTKQKKRKRTRHR